MNIFKRIFNLMYPSKTTLIRREVNKAISVIRDNDNIGIDPDTALMLWNAVNHLESEMIDWDITDAYYLNLYLSMEDFEKRLKRLLPEVSELNYNINPMDFKGTLSEYRLMDWSTNHGDYVPIYKFIMKHNESIKVLLEGLMIIDENGTDSDKSYFEKLTYCSLHDIIQLYSVILMSLKEGALNEGTTISL